jgi:Fe-S cluster biogenesis protein NfuA
VRDEAEKLIADYLRPLVEADGGKIDLIEVTSTRVVVRLSGTCCGCPGQPYTVSRVIEPAIKQAFGADVEVEARFGP